MWKIINGAGSHGSTLDASNATHRASAAECESPPRGQMPSPESLVAASISLANAIKHQTSAAGSIASDLRVELVAPDSMLAAKVAQTVFLAASAQDQLLTKEVITAAVHHEPPYFENYHTLVLFNEYSTISAAAIFSLENTFTGPQIRRWLHAPIVYSSSNNKDIEILFLLLVLTSCKLDAATLLISPPIKSTSDKHMWPPQAMPYGMAQILSRSLVAMSYPGLAHWTTRPLFEDRRASFNLKRRNSLPETPDIAIYIEDISAQVIASGHQMSPRLDRFEAR
jgi:hypothetical protein